MLDKGNIFLAVIEHRQSIKMLAQLSSLLAG
jgi:hypothetical protein